MEILRGIRLYGKALKLKRIDAKSQSSTNNPNNQTIGTFVQSDLINPNYIDVELNYLSTILIHWSMNPF